MFNKNMLIPLVLLLASGCARDLGLSSDPINVSGTIQHLEDKNFVSPRIIPDFTKGYVDLYPNEEEENAFLGAAASSILPKLLDFLGNKIKEGATDETSFIATNLNLQSGMHNKGEKNYQVPKYYTFKSKNYEFQFSIDTWGDNKSAVIFKIHSFNFIEPINRQLIDNNFRNITIEFTFKNIRPDEQKSQSTSTIAMGNIALESKLKLDNNVAYYETPMVQNPFYGHSGKFLANLEIKVQEKRYGNKVAKLTSDIGKELDDIVIKKLIEVIANDDVKNMDKNSPKVDIPIAKSTPNDQNPQEASEVDNITQ